MKSWIAWSGSEGVVRGVFIRGIQKMMGTGGFSKTLPGLVLTTFIANGLATTAMGLIGARVKRQKLLVAQWLILGFVAIGAISTGQQFFSLKALAPDKSLITVVTLVVGALSIIIGALLDRIFFRVKLEPLQYAGIVIFVFALYSILNFPQIAVFIALPSWILSAVVVGVLFAVNETIIKAIQAKAAGKFTISPFVNNFWTGLTATTITVVWLTAISGWNIAMDLPDKFWYLAIALGATSFGVLSMKLKAYEGIKKPAGKPEPVEIAKRKTVMWGVYLSTAMAVEVLYYGDPFTAGKGLGLILFLVAFVLMDKDNREAITKFLAKRRSALKPATEA